MPEPPNDVFAIREFRFLMAAKFLATLAFQIQTIAVGWQIYSLTKSPLSLGFIGLSEALPSIGVALYAGHIADVLERKLIATATFAVLLVCISVQAFCSFQLHDSSTLVFVTFAIVALSGFARGFYNPSMFGLISEIVPRELYGNASAYSSACWQASSIAGPILGGFVYFALGASSTYAVSAVLIALALIGFLFIKGKGPPAHVADISVVANIKEGLKFVTSNEIVLGAMALDLFAVLFGGATALLPIFVSEVFHEGPRALGILRAAPSIGALLMSLWLARYPIRNRAGEILLCSVAGFGICMILFGLSTNYLASIILLAVSGGLDGVSVYLRSTIFQLVTPGDMKGRFAAVNSIFIGSSNEIGEFESGVAAKFLGLVPSVVFGGCMTLLVVAITCFKAPQLRKLNMSNLLEPTREP